LDKEILKLQDEADATLDDLETKAKALQKAEARVAELESKAVLLAQQLTRLCDQAELNQKLQKQNDDLINYSKQLERELHQMESEHAAQIETKEMEIESVIADTEKLAVKLATFGVIAKFTDAGIVYSESEVQTPTKKENEPLPQVPIHKDKSTSPRDAIDDLLDM